MFKMHRKYLVGFIIIAAAFLYLVWTSFRASFQFALTPAELSQRHAQFEGKVVKVSGTVKKDSISFKEMDYNFIITDDGIDIAAHYKGIVPNTFREGAEVVATGRFEATLNTFEATELLTKCASKYEAKKR